MEKNLDFYLNMAYPFTVRPDLDDGGYIVEFPDLRYCVGTGDSVEDAIADAMKAKHEWITAAYENDISIPEPADEKRDGLERYSGRLSLRIPKSLHKMVMTKAKREGVSANQLLTHLISMGIGGRV